MTLVAFLVPTFAISLAGFACIALIPAARSPERAVALPFWLLMVWGPSLAALILSFRDGTVGALLGRAVIISTVPPVVWLLVAAPLGLVLALRAFAPDAPTALSPGLVAGLVAFNLILGPLGEEMGWRGVLQTDLNLRMGWLEASLLVGVIWTCWHLPLWTIDTPHARIPLLLFAAHVMLYSVIIGAAHTLSGGSILPAIALHLSVNLVAQLAVFAGFQAADAWFRTSLPGYAGIAVGAVLLVWLGAGQTGLAPGLP